MTRSIVLLAAMFALNACGQTSAPQPAPRPSVTQDLTVSDAAQHCFVTAAESLEGLTEKAAATPIAELAREAASAAAQARSCQPSLTAQQSANLDNVLGAIGQFETTGDRSALALAAVEGYRTFVSAQSRPPGSIPVEVALLDYAGFRYQAGSRSTPPLWDDMRRALDFADGQWRTVSPRVSDSQLKTAFGGDLAEMRAAIAASDQAHAQRAASSELDHVDALERYFSPS